MILTTGRLMGTRKSFTLIEMLVVLAVAILILGVSIPFFSGFTKGTKLKAAAKDVSGILRTARTLAITHRKNYSVIFDDSTRPHSYYTVDDNEQVYEKKYFLSSSVKFYRPADPGHFTTFPSAEATFSSTGCLTGSSGSVWISDKKGNLRRISVSNTTGRVRIDKEP